MPRHRTTNTLVHSKHSSGLNLNESQSIDAPATAPNVLVVPALSQVNFGGNSILELREMGCLLNNLTIEFNVSAIQSSNNSSAYYIPACFWIQKIELVQNSQVLSTIYGNGIFLENQLCYSDEEQIKLNNGMGNYQNPSLMQMKSSTTSSYFVNVKSLFDNSIPLLSNKHNIQLKLYMNTIDKLLGYTLGPSPVLLSSQPVINYCNLICFVERLTQNHILHLEKQLSKSYNHHIYNDVVYQPFTYNISANSTIDLTLTGITGRVSTLLFTCKAATSAATQFKKITKFDILSNSNSSLVGGTPITHDLNLLMTKHYFPSTYTQELGFPYGVYNGQQLPENSYCYVYSWSRNPEESMKKNLVLGAYRFTGNERLRLYFDSSYDGSSCNIDVFAYVENVYQMGLNEVKKIQL